MSSTCIFNKLILLKCVGRLSNKLPATIQQLFIKKESIYKVTVKTNIIIIKTKTAKFEINKL